MIRVGIAGASGYTGIELIRLLSQHPRVQITRLYSKSQVGIPISQIYPQLFGHFDLTLEAMDDASLAGIDVLFLALPHGQAQFHYDLLKRSGIVVIDLSADFRLADAGQYQRYYGDVHQRPDLLGTIPLGLPEVYRDGIQQANYIACPGCYATSVMVGLYPLAQAGLLKSPVIADCKSGVSGAGRGLKESSLYCEANASFSAYGTFTHRHTPEMENLLGVSVLFSPHLTPMSRGILSTMYVDAAISEADLIARYNDMYQTAPFITIMPGLKTPNTKYVSGTNQCLITFKVIPELQKIVVFSALDNLIKGASGQAIQCMNIRMGLDETTGLPRIAPYL
ncbi:N-acetyl-gamma-glutamyl-phosphate reductase [bacterium]|nr:N-acetyl-gamma-glutamyl-phosphate reductase [bacterium]